MSGSTDEATFGSMGHTVIRRCSAQSTANAKHRRLLRTEESSKARRGRDDIAESDGWAAPLRFACRSTGGPIYIRPEIAV